MWWNSKITEAVLVWTRRFNGKKMNAYKILVGKSIGKYSLWGWLEDYIELDVREADDTT
jgi:hypothetical protein